jgi:hypothetical protein
MSEVHKHADCIIAWANGKEVEVMDSRGNFVPVCPHPYWHEHMQYRIKPETKPDFSLYTRVCVSSSSIPKENKRGFVYEAEQIIEMLPSTYKMNGDNLNLVFDGETGKLKSAEVISDD